MDQWVFVFAIKADDLNAISETHMAEKGNRPLQVTREFCVSSTVCACTHDK